MTENHESSNNKSFELVNEELVKDALRNDKGENAELLSWTVKDFTKKGDNYTTLVACVDVKYSDEKGEHDESYVAKLNPLRTQRAFIDIMKHLFSHESEILFDVIGGMNKCLKKLNQPPIKTPKLFAKNLEEGKEGFLTENLRKLGFIMYDRRKGMDLNHSNLVMEELGRYHASSLLFEDVLSPRTFKDTFKTFEVVLSADGEAFKALAAMIASQAANSAKFLKTLPKYEPCVRYLNANGQNMSQHYLEGLTMSKKPFDVLIHGDCWTNNILFKYDEDGKPVDVRFVDLQTSGKASPVCDILYFFYSSLGGDVRSKNFQKLLYTYYQSFSKILIFGRKKVPFTFQQLEEEVQNNLIFGITCGIFLIPSVLAEGDDELLDFDKFSDDNIDGFSESLEKKFSLISQKDGPFKERFLALFDDMLQSNILGEG